MIAKELVKKLKKIEIYTSRLANDQLVGSYHSVFKGQGIAFSEARQYHPGDDVRFIDWNVSARMNDTYVKLFAEEREMTVMLLVDLSKSERFGSVAKPKIETVAEISALLAFSATKNNDRIGLILFTDRVEQFVPPKKGRSHVMRVVTEILNAQPKGSKTDLKVALDMLGHMSKRKTVTFLVSDFIAQDYEKPLTIISAKHDLIPIEVTDPREDNLPDIGLALMEDLETGALVEVDTSNSKVRAQFRQDVQQQRAARNELFKRLRLDHITVGTDRNYVQPLVNFFRIRKQRLTGYR